MRIFNTLILAFICVIMGACATGEYSQGDCDPAIETCACDKDKPCPAGWACAAGKCVAATDAGTTADKTVSDANDGGLTGDGTADAGDSGSDAKALGDFGDPCTDKKQCKSKICILAGVTGFCSKLCPSGKCPTGYNCYGVLDTIEQGKVTNVCVMESNMLCTPCKKDSECAKIGQDLCLDYPGDGASYCGRDCAKVSCPTGYQCKQVTVSGSSYKQCVPASGSCTCGAATTGKTKKCTIKTSFGACEGTSTCKGLSGWATCAPPSAKDAPDAKYTDDNCDGIDGDITGGVFVGTGGSDSATCGLLYTSPCKTIAAGITQAAAKGLAYVYVQAGQYKEVIDLKAGIHVIGGYDAGWKRGTRGKLAHKVSVLGGLDSGQSQYMTVRAHNLAKATTMMDLVLIGPHAGGSTAGGARSSHVVHADTVSGLTMARVTIQAGNGASGTNGAPGGGAANVNASSAMTGGSGGKGKESFKTCDKSTRGAGGKAGTNSCSGGPTPTGGKGGRGGTMDNGCTCLWGNCTCLPNSCDATSGEAGGNAAHYKAGGYGYRGAGGAGKSSCGAGGAGTAGRVHNGAGGSQGEVAARGYEQRVELPEVITPPG